MKKNKISYFIFPQCLLSTAFIFINKVYAASGSVITFSNVDNLLWSIIKTLQYYTLPVMTLALVFLGIKLVASGDDTATKDIVKNWMFRILVGGLFVFGSSMIAEIIKTAVS